MDVCQVCMCALYKQAAVLLYNEEKRRFTFFFDLSRYKLVNLLSTMVLIIVPDIYR